MHSKYRYLIDEIEKLLSDDNLENQRYNIYNNRGLPNGHLLVSSIE